MDISDLEFLLFLSQDFVSKEAQANNEDINGELLPESFAGTSIEQTIVICVVNRTKSNSNRSIDLDWAR